MAEQPTPEDCPQRAFHGNPFRYCGVCPWTEQADWPTFIVEVRKVLAELDEAQEDYWTTCLEADGVEHVETISLDEHRWYTVKLDVYRRKLDGALVGVRWDSPATEEQEGQDRNAEAVDVEAYTTTSYRVKAS